MKDFNYYTKPNIFYPRKREHIYELENDRIYELECEVRNLKENN